MVITLVGVTLWALGIMVSAARGSVTEPYGGCKEAYQAPHSQGAKECRAKGWTIKRRLVVTPHAVVRFTRLPHCREEDGSGQRSACTWNIGRKIDGDGQGLSYWVSGPHARHHDRIHYVWPERPLGTPVSQELGDALAEGEQHEDWDRCWLDEPRTHVRCPDGFETRVWGQK